MKVYFGKEHTNLARRTIGQCTTPFSLLFSPKQATKASNHVFHSSIAGRIVREALGLEHATEVADISHILVEALVALSKNPRNKKVLCVNFVAS